MKKILLWSLVALLVVWITAQSMANGKGKGKGGGKSGTVSESVQKGKSAAAEGKAEAKEAASQAEEQSATIEQVKQRGKGKNAEVTEAAEAGQEKAKGKAKGKFKSEQEVAEVQAEAKEKVKQQFKGAKQKAKETRAQGEEATAKRRKHQQQLMAIQDQMNHELAKHGQRQARLARIKELALMKGNEKLASKVDELAAKESGRHQRKMQRLAERHQKVWQLDAAATEPAKPEKGKVQKQVQMTEAAPEVEGQAGEVPEEVQKEESED